MDAVFFMISVPAFLLCGNFILQYGFVGSRCTTVILDTPPNPRISKIILYYTSGGLLVQVISNVLMFIVIICIAMGFSGTILNGLIQLFSHLLWVMFPLLGPLLSARYIVPHMYAFFCVMLEQYTSTPHLWECPWLALILVYMITLWPMTHAVKHWTWHNNALQTIWLITFSNLPLVVKTIIWLVHL